MEGGSISRQNRKIDHLRYAVRAWGRPGENGFEDICPVHQALPELDPGEVDTSVSFLGKRLEAPLLINAMTGGHPAVKEINRSLARVARESGIAMAVGSQQAALDDPRVRDTFTVARDENPGGVLLANVSAATPPELVAGAVEMIRADGVQLHLNAAQELLMTEGERSFKGVLANIERVVSQSAVPVVVKEVGCGLSRDTVAELSMAGVRYVDTGGRGGTSFAVIEMLRSGREDADCWSGWGIPTAASLIEIAGAGLPVFIIASGGLASGLDVARALALGAGLAGMAGHLLKVLLEQSEGALLERVNTLIGDLRRAMLLTGSRNLRELAAKPVVITGKTAEWLTRRGVDIGQYARRPQRKLE
ncbi:MAG: type 2 isopentenyl-diphosphate Delta-isomerase [Peptococcaceae bacterium]|nr:type 2 isopentenyl-diphosphate Delta-isomerase [Peptococcaceae bacterium]